MIIWKHIYSTTDAVLQELFIHLGNLSNFYSLPKLMYLIFSWAAASKGISGAVLNAFEFLFVSLKPASPSGIGMSNGIFWCK